MVQWIRELPSMRNVECSHPGREKLESKWVVIAPLPNAWQQA